MKVPVLIEYSDEKIVDVTIEDIISAIEESPNSTVNIFRGLNNIAQFLKAIPDYEIKKMSSSQMDLIHDFFVSQADRFLTNKDKPNG